MLPDWKVRILTPRTPLPCLKTLNITEVFPLCFSIAPGAVIWTLFATFLTENVGESETKAKLLMQSGKFSIPTC